MTTAVAAAGARGGIEYSISLQAPWVVCCRPVCHADNDDDNRQRWPAMEKGGEGRPPTVTHYKLAPSARWLSPVVHTGSHQYHQFMSTGYRAKQAQNTDPVPLPFTLPFPGPAPQAAIFVAAEGLGQHYTERLTDAWKDQKSIQTKKTA